MDYETFDRLHKSNPLLFSLAMESFLDKGRIAILESGQSDLTDFILHKLAVLLSESSLRKTVETITAFAQMDTGDLLRYARRSGYYLGGGTEDEKLDGPF